MYKNQIKRLLDLLFTIIIIPCLIIIILLIAIIMLSYDKGPIFYNAPRLGKKGKPFKMFKFRTMVVNAPDIRLQDGSTYNADDDPRITKIGHFLRKRSLDELPQIFNVLIGEMSIIGPRPDPLDDLYRYTEEERIILSIKPGITGYNQAYYRNSVDGPTKLKNDIYYVHNISFMLDIQIFFKTIKSVLLGNYINKS
jgi:undecaprenyl phosphate N,N'-diacetylbacillosamine 1-phosphate transferase